MDGGALPGSNVLPEHFALGSTCVILSRAFCNTNLITDLGEIKEIFQTGVKSLREYYEFCSEQNDEFFTENHKELQEKVAKICE